MLCGYVISVFLLCGISHGEELRNLRVGAFNIQILGVTKAKNQEVMDILVKIIRRYDLLLIQEIRDASDTAIHKLLQQVNDLQQEPFSMVLSNRLGRSTSKEQYAYFYRPAAGLKVLKQYVYKDTVIEDNKVVDLFEREPFIVSFSSSKTAISAFGLIGIHVAPKTAPKEINYLYKYVFDDAKAKLGLPDVMLIGDLNAECNYVSKSKWSRIPLKSDPSYNWLIDDATDTTTIIGTDCAYDRFVATGPDWKFGIVPDSATVYKFDQDKKTIGTIDHNLAKAVSDHYPIEFLLANKQYVVFKVTNRVLVKLVGEYAKSGSLPFADINGDLYYKLLVSESNSVLEVRDAAGNTVGELNHVTGDEKLLSKYLIIARTKYPTLEMYVHPFKRRYSGKQKSDLYLAVPAAKQTIVKTIRDVLFMYVCKSTQFVCSEER